MEIIGDVFVNWILVLIAITRLCRQIAMLASRASWHRMRNQWRSWACKTSFWLAMSSLSSTCSSQSIWPWKMTSTRRSSLKRSSSRSWILWLIGREQMVVGTLWKVFIRMWFTKDRYEWFVSFGVMWTCW